MSDQTWMELVGPTVARCELASKMGMAATFNSDGADALGKLLKIMATNLDGAIAAAYGQDASAVKEDGDG